MGRLVSVNLWLGQLVFLLVNYWVYRQVSERLKRETMYLMLFGAALVVVGWVVDFPEFLLGFTVGLFVSAWILAFTDHFRRGLDGED